MKDDHDKFIINYQGLVPQVPRATGYDLKIWTHPDSLQRKNSWGITHSVPGMVPPHLAEGEGSPT
jgi:hypothetical protein